MTSPRIKNLTIRVSVEEYDLIQQKAQASNLSPSSYLREIIFFDIPQIEHHSFEFKVLKALSYCVGSLKMIAEKEFTKEDINAQAAQVMIKNGIDPEKAKKQSTNLTN